MKTSKTLLLLSALLLMIAWIPMGCGGGSSGGGGSATPAPNIQVDQTSFDFGSITVGKTGTLQVLVQNTGTADLSVNDLVVSDLTNFGLSTGTCGSAPYTLAAGGQCTVTLTFSPTTVGSFSETLTISSNDGDTPSFTATLTGAGTEPTALNVSLNQIDPTGCPTITAYVSVTDQNGFAVTGLTAGDFSIAENGGGAAAPDDLDYAENAALSMATAIIMDYSLSVRSNESLVAAMKSAATNFVNQMNSTDEGEIIKFATTVEVSQAFTTDKTALTDAIAVTPDIGDRTALYDAIWQGVTDAAARTTNRKAVIILTDGVDWGGSAGVPGSVHSKDEVINLAQSEGIPIFTIGVGDEVDPLILEELAADSGGQYFDAPSTDRIQTIYAQLSEILDNQYVLTYDSPLSGGTVSVVVSVPNDVPTAGVIGGDSDPLSYAGCP